MKIFKSFLTYNNKNIFKASNKNTLNSLLPNSKSLIFLMKNKFSTINLRTHQGTIQFNNQSFEKDSSIRKNLSKYWILPKENLFYNKKITEVFNDDNSENTLISGLGKISQVEFDRFAVKTGLGLSNSSNIYVNDYLLNGKKVRFVTSDLQASARFNALNGENTTFENADLLVYANNTEKPTAKKFALFDKAKGVILTNSQSLNSIKSVIEKIIS
jgi:hypothetical protein